MSAATAARARGVCSSCINGRHDRCPAPNACKCTNCPGTDTTGELERLRKKTGVAPAKPAAPAKSNGAVVWEDPPPVRSGPGSRVFPEEVEAALRARPGQWARVRAFSRRTSASSVATRFRNGKTHLNKDEWELAARRVDGGSALWARFVGKG